MQPHLYDVSFIMYNADVCKNLIKLSTERKEKGKNEEEREGIFRNHCSSFEIIISEGQMNYLLKFPLLCVGLLSIAGNQLCGHFQLGETCPMCGVYVRCDLMDITTYHPSWGSSLTLDIETRIFSVFKSKPDKLGVSSRKEAKHRVLFLSAQYPDGINLVSPRNPLINCNTRAD